MKYIKPHNKLLYSYSFAVIIISFLLIEFATSYVINAFYFHWIVLAATLIVIISPFGKEKLAAESKETPRYSILPWLSRLFALQLSLFFVYLGMALVFSHWLPLTTSHPHAINQTLTTLLKKDGLLPWAIYAFYASGLAYVSYVKNQDAYASSLLSPIFKKTRPETVLGIVLNLQSRSAVFSVLATTFAFITLLIATIITPHNTPLLTGFHAKTMVILVALIALGFTPPSKKILKKLLTPKIPLYITITTTLILFALLIWLLNGLFGHFGETPIPIPEVIQWLKRKSPIKLWIIFSGIWWIGWTPLIAAHIAKLSRGHRIRNMLLAILFLPLILTVLIIQFPNVLNIFDHFPVIVGLLSMTAFIYLIIVLTEKMALPMMIRCYLPKRDLYKHRDHYFYFRKLFQLMLIVIYLYLPTGLSVTLYVVFTLAFSFVLQIPFHLAAMLFRLFHKTRDKNPKNV